MDTMEKQIKKKLDGLKGSAMAEANKEAIFEYIQKLGVSRDMARFNRSLQPFYLRPLPGTSG